MSNITEKRKHARIKTAVPLQYNELHGNTYLVKGTLTKDLSNGGVRFISDRFVGLACHLMLEIQLPSMSGSIKAISKPAWIKKTRYGTDYEIGSHFLALTSEDASLLANFTRSSS